MSRPSPVADLEAGSRDAAAVLPTEAGSSRPPAGRSYSLNVPSFLRSSNAPSPLLPEPATASTGAAPTTNSSGSSTSGRNRAHTVSVSVRNRNRAASISQRDRKGSGTASISARRRSGSIASSLRRSGEGPRGGEERAGSPVNFEVQGNGETRELNDEVVGMLDCIDPQVATSKSYCFRFYETVLMSSEPFAKHLEWSGIPPLAGTMEPPT